MLPSSPISLVRGQTLQIILESWFIQHVVLTGSPFSLETDLGSITNRVVVYLEVYEPAHSIIDQLVEQGNRVILLQMGDEILAKYDPSAYKKCHFVLRNYFFQSIFNDVELGSRVYWIPNGFRTGIGPRNRDSLRPSSLRRRLGLFMGWLDNSSSVRNERAEFKEEVKNCGGLIQVHETPGFGSGASPALYAALMEDSVFAPCPAGNAIETIRFYDALELGCIPITTSADYLQDPRALPDPPFPVLNHWSELPMLSKQLLSLYRTDPKRLDAIQHSCLEWWSKAKLSASLLIPRLAREMALMKH